MPSKAVCANPLFLEWLEEAAGEAADKGSKTEFAYRKAAKSFKQCPVTFEHPEQTRQLNGVGDSIISFLTRRLMKHCADHGDAMPDKPEPVRKLKAKRKAAAPRVQSDDDDDDDGVAAGSNARAGPSSTLSAGGFDGLDSFRKERVPSRPTGVENDDDDSANEDPDFLRAMAEMEHGPPAAKKAKKAAKPKKRYFPKHKSGAYAILLALHSVSSTDDMHAELSKREIVEIAESRGWSDASFNKPKDGSFATAWNGMSTLVSKGYCIQKGSRMAKFHLSEEGFEVAQAQYDLLPVDPFEQDRRDRLSQLPALSQPSSVQPTVASLRRVDPTFRVDLEAITGPDKVPPRPSSSPLDVLNAASGRSNASAGTTFARVHSAPAAAFARTSSSSRADRLAEILALATNRSHSQAAASSSRAYSTTSATLSVPTAEARVSRPTPLGAGGGSSVKEDGPNQRPRSSVLIHSTGVADGEPSVAVDTTFRPIVWHAGSYEIVLLMDHREKAGKQGEQGAVPLRNMGVPAETSNDMVLGDIMWVARRTDGGQEGGVQACVLDYIIERKRLDDLVSSIRDGRFREQKMRLKNSGIGQVVYLLERYHVGDQQDAWWSAVTTSKSSMQIIDSFFVHESESWEGSMAYLKSMHEAIVDIHKNESLYIIPDDKIHRPTYSELQKQLRLKYPTRPHLTSVQSFKLLNAKNASMTYRDVWCKMLLTIAGLSPEKVAAIVDVYPTAMSLVQAFKEAEAVEREARAASVGQPGKPPKIPLAAHLLSNTIPGSNRQKIGPALSKKVYELLRAKKYASAPAEEG